MNPEIIISVLALFVAAVAAVASIAGLADEGRARLAQWASKSYRVGYVLFMLFSMLNGLAGVLFFGLVTTPPTRKDILTLLLFLINIGVGMHGLYKISKAGIPASETKRGNGE